MMTEDYVSFETAKLLKEKGFNGEYHMYYVEGGRFKCDNLRDIKDYAKSIVEFNYLHNTKVPDPTLQMACKWLREVHKLHITILWDCGACIGKNSFCYHIDRIDNYEDKGYNKIGFDSYEEAVESAIKYCIENLI